MLNWKRCSRCKNLKPIDDFYWANKDKELKHSHCIECDKALADKKKKYYKEWYEKNRDKKKEKSRQYREKERAKRIKLRRRKEFKFGFDDVNVALKENVSSAIVQNLLGKSKNKEKIEDLIGYPIDNLKEHLEEQIPEHFGWKHINKYWWIKHIIPLSFYNYSDPDEIRKSWDIRNISITTDNLNTNVPNSFQIIHYGIEDLIPNSFVIDL